MKYVLFLFRSMIINDELQRFFHHCPVKKENLYPFSNSAIHHISHMAIYAYSNIHFLNKYPIDSIRFSHST